MLLLLSEYNFLKVNFIDPASPLMYGIIELHDHIFFFLNMILFLVFFLLFTTIRYFTYLSNSVLNRYLLVQTSRVEYVWSRLNSGVSVEIIWTVIPSIILILIAIPSFSLLYATDELVDPSLTVQVIGHQWYWSYEYNDLVVKQTDIEFEKRASNISKEFSQAVRGHILRPALYNYIYTENIEMQLFKAFGQTLDELPPLYPDLTWEETGREFMWKPALSTRIPTFATTVDPMWKPVSDTHTPISAASIDPAYRAALNKCTFIRARTIDPWFFYTERGLSERLSKLIFSDRLTSGSVDFDSYMLQESELALGELRLYETDFPLVLPKFTHIRFMITADDVIHSRSIPALGIKVDAVPGRINHAHTYIKYSGVFYGQCSELCGVNHAFMPIQVLVFDPQLYYDYVRLLLKS